MRSPGYASGKFHWLLLCSYPVTLMPLPSSLSRHTNLLYVRCLEQYSDPCTPCCWISWQDRQARYSSQDSYWVVFCIYAVSSSYGVFAALYFKVELYFYILVWYPTLPPCALIVSACDLDSCMSYAGNSCDFLYMMYRTMYVPTSAIASCFVSLCLWHIVKIVTKILMTSCSPFASIHPFMDCRCSWGKCNNARLKDLLLFSYQFCTLQ